jgi:hypothetical protein
MPDNPHWYTLRKTWDDDRSDVMRRKRLFLGVAAWACVGLAAVWFVWLRTPTPGITSANLRRIEMGMTQQQVEDILGGPPMHRVEYPVIGVGGRPSRARPQEGHLDRWCGDELSIDVLFDGQGRVLRRNGSVLEPPREPTVFDRLREQIRDWLW